MLAWEYATVQYNLTIKTLPFMACITTSPPPREDSVSLDHAFEKNL